ncbi:response regulator transcription factor [Macrococcus sp. EM39E]|uniref:response regulator transcription factor n=1 Tax=Macrococcus animalis TaxID=3395467 RepID=UPI0039BECF7F
MDNHVLIVEDDLEIAHLLSLMLTKMHIKADMAFDGNKAKDLMSINHYDLILLDLMLPNIDVVNLLKLIKQTIDSKVIVISAKSDINDKVNLLQQGADDYITKPFENKEVEARVLVQLRNSTSNTMKDFVHRDLTLNTVTREVLLMNEIIKLTNSEFEILTELIKKPGIPISKREIYENIGHGTYVGDDNTISVHVSNIRKKFENITSEVYIKTIWGIGFMLV